MYEHTFPHDLKEYRIHMVGIKGTGMAALAELLIARGAILSGSDVADSFYTDAILKDLGIIPCNGFAAENIPLNVQTIIYSSAYSLDKNPELLDAVSRRLPILTYFEALGIISARSYSCGISGVHGKTTTTAMVGSIIKNTKLDVSVLAGSIVSSFNNRCTLLQGDRYFIAETCEYQKHFLSFRPKKIILTSIESDHQDYFPTYESILSAFMQYIDLLPQFGELIYCADDPGACEAAKMIFSSRPDIIFTSYGEKACGDYKITISGIKNGLISFTLKAFDTQFSLKVPGVHNVKNATAAIALAVSLLKEENEMIRKEDIQRMKSSLLDFSGTKRRSEIIGEASGVLVIDDYAHHPTAIKTTLEGLRDFYPHKKIIVSFMSHTYSRTSALLQEFASSLTVADEIILHKIYASAREEYDGSVTGETLFKATRQKHKNVHYFEEVLDARSYLSESLKTGDLFVTMGAGDNWKLGPLVLEDRGKI